MGPSINAMPAQGKPFDVFVGEDATCRQWAQRQIGDAMYENYDNEFQHRYDNAYIQCMYAYGNQVPGIRSAARVRAPLPPPPASAAAPVPAGLTDVPPDAVAPPPNTPPPQAGMPQAGTAPPPQSNATPAPQPGAAPQSLNAPPPTPPEAIPAQYAAPEPIVLGSAPQFVYVPQTGLYVAVGVPYDLVYTGSEYFYRSGGHWFRSAYYNGPWVFATREFYPASLIRFNIGDIRHYRDYEFRQWQRNGRRYRGHFYRPEIHK
jgi:hypothetical protein